MSSQPGSGPRPTLTAAQGGEFIPLIEECADGRWRASAVIRVSGEEETLEQSCGIELFTTEEQARDWIERVASSRGFTSYHLHKIIPGN
jgi:hypothetical protein